MAKRKRIVVEDEARALGASTTTPTRILTEEQEIAGELKKRKLENGKSKIMSASQTIQIIVGTYEKILHGVTATIPHLGIERSQKVEFEDTFLFKAHDSPIKCLALSSSSPSQKSARVILASGGSDQIINLYYISTVPPQKVKGPPIPTLSGKTVSENPRNQEIGSLQHHGGHINALCFPTRSKLLSAAEDNTIAVTRTRDWTVLSTIKAPIPKAHGRPSGDTAPLGGTPAGVNDFAIHPSMKLMVSVGKGEKCMRLWNLVTGKKAAVLNFDRELLQSVGEGRWAGEGRRIEWNGQGEEFVVAFEKGCVVYGIDSKPKCRILPLPNTKVHQLHYLTPPGTEEASAELLAVSTEDARILFYSTSQSSPGEANGSNGHAEIPRCDPIAQLGGAVEGLIGRIKDFQVLSLPDTDDLVIVTGSSDGAIRLWVVSKMEFTARQASTNGAAEIETNGHTKEVEETPEVAKPKQIGRLLGTYEAGNRITCLKAFVMSAAPIPEDIGLSGIENGAHDEHDDGVTSAS